ncbi:unnamed protein product [Euphydryas editha]|uniref:Uncharacterized protein n=1 Tax=Euphydryas editha TaxID=104508 RepID=A0AAU9UWW3_EUPED|nr:unnamed protein product [Euphydryas editha]
MQERFGRNPACFFRSSDLIALDILARITLLMSLDGSEESQCFLNFYFDGGFESLSSKVAVIVEADEFVESVVECERRRRNAHASAQVALLQL